VTTGWLTVRRLVRSFMSNLRRIIPVTGRRCA
jgi:hypothetical protein